MGERCLTARPFFGFLSLDPERCQGPVAPSLVLGEVAFADASRKSRVWPGQGRANAPSAEPG